MGQLEILIKLDIAQSSHKKRKEKKRKSFNALVDYSNENSIVLHGYIGKILKSHDSKLVHFTHQRTCVAFNA
jgi:hypothetical protein